MPTNYNQNQPEESKDVVPEKIQGIIADNTVRIAVEAIFSDFAANGDAEATLEEILPFVARQHSSVALQYDISAAQKSYFENLIELQNKLIPIVSSEFAEKYQQKLEDEMCMLGLNMSPGEFKDLLSQNS